MVFRKFREQSILLSCWHISAELQPKTKQTIDPFRLSRDKIMQLSVIDEPCIYSKDILHHKFVTNMTHIHRNQQDENWAQIIATHCQTGYQKNDQMAVLDES